jgi:methylenetetrahydrofolate dehydrogenase (NADP+)/methenyltetrahydrofolate cyclohydrolase
MSLLLDAAGATVTVVHKETQNSYELNSQADILVVAAGVRGLVGPKDVKQDAVVIDVGIHRSPDGKLSGDVQFDLVKDRCSYITPVPGGVGPLTVCTLLENTLQAQKQNASSTS